MNSEDVKLLNEYLKMFVACKNSVVADSATVKKYWCDKSLFVKARMGALGFLERLFGDDNVYFKEMQSKVKVHELGDVETAIGILQAVALNETNKG